jgi:hypothetical protein
MIKEETKERLARMAERYRAHVETLRGPEPAQAEAAHLAVYKDVVRPVVVAFAAELEKSGHETSFALEERPPALEFRIVIDGRDEQVIRFSWRPRDGRTEESVAMLERAHHPFELRRFDSPAEITPDVIEHVLVEALEQIFASAASRAR